MITRLLMFVGFLMFSSAMLSACGPTECTGTNCACGEALACTFASCSATTANCNFSCTGKATCSGTCGSNCNASCAGAQCTHTVGAGANVSCVFGSCTISCADSCNVEVSADSSPEPVAHITCQKACTVSPNGQTTITCASGNRSLNAAGVPVGCAN
jgi:hypothetical protein